MHRPDELPADARRLAVLADAEPTSFWLSATGRPEPGPALVGDQQADLVVVGAGYSGLWTALQAKEDDPSRDVVVLESAEVGWAASGRNGGFCVASLTHGFFNGLARFEPELATLVRLGHENLDGIEATLTRYGIDAEFERTGELSVAVAPWQVDELREAPELAREYGVHMQWRDRDEVQADVHSPTYLGGLFEPESALVHPARLAWGLADACRSLGVRIHERTPALGLERDGAGMRVRTPYGSVRAARVALATNVFPSLLRRVRSYIAPVYDYVLATEPLSAEQLESVGWKSRVGVGDSANQFHYYRLTADQRIVWGGYDAVYHYGNGLRPELDQRPETFAMLAAHFAETFPHARGAAVQPRLGRRDRHLQPVLPVLGDRVRRPRRLRDRLHRARGRRHPVRGPRPAGPACRPSQRADRPGVCAVQAAPVPAGAAAMGGHRADPPVAGPGRPQRRSAQPLAQGPGHGRPRLRLLSRPGQANRL